MLLQNMRDQAQGWATKVVVTIIAFTFAIFGLESLRPNVNNPDVATVNGVGITQQQLFETLDQQRRVLMQQMGQNFDPAILESPALQAAALESLIQRTLISERLKADHMVASEALLDDFIRQIPEFQVDGQYSPERVMMFVQSMGMSVAQFRNMLREELTSNQLRIGIADSEFMTAYELEQLNKLQNQTRDVAWTVLDSSKAEAAQAISDEDVQVFYDANKARFMHPEQVSLDYVVIDKNVLAEEITISDADVKSAYDQRLTELKAKADAEQHASMILLETSESRNLAATMAEAQKISKTLKEGGDFAAQAKRFSDDSDSAARGGSLGAVEAGFFGEAFDNALAALTPGQTSEPLETDFGVVIIRRDQNSKARIPSLEQMRTSLVNELRAQQVEPLFVERSQQLADISFEASDLTQPAETLGLTIEQTKLFSRAGGEGIAADQKVIDAAFSAEVLDLRANSDLIELSPERIAVIHVREHNKAEPMAVADVRDEIVKELRAQQVAEQLQAQAEKLVAELDNGTGRDQIAKQNGLSWNIKDGLNRFRRSDVPALVQVEAFRLPHPAKDQFVAGIAKLDNGDVAVLQISNVALGSTEMPAEQKRMLSQSLAQRNGEQIFQEYVRSLRDHADIEIFTEESNEG